MCGHWLHYHRCRLHRLTNILLFVLFFYHETFCGLSPSESDSEVSLSGFETVASQSFDEDEEEDEGSIMLSSPCSSPTSMLQEDHHGDKDEAQPNGITKHRSAGLYAPPHPPFSKRTPYLLSATHQKLNSTKESVFSYQTVTVFLFDVM